MAVNVTFRVLLERPPAGVDYGVQVGRGTRYTTVQTQRSTGRDLRFEFTASIKGAAPGPPDFAGPVVQGPPGQRFVYIDIGTYAGQTGTPWARRLKIPLAGVTWDTLDGASRPDPVLEARVAGTARDGGPACATVKPFDGWTPAR
jgi:hypothetical protein